MQNRAKAAGNTRHLKSRRSASARPTRWTPLPTADAVRPEIAQKSYERYLALARAEAQAGDLIRAENFYQHAEHYFRSMHSDRDQTGDPPINS